MTGLQSWVLNYLLNAAWQVPLLFATAWIAARLLRSAGATVEHKIWASALVLETLLPACSLPSAQISAVMLALRAWLFGAKPSVGAQVTVSVGPGYVQSGVHLAPTLLTVIIALYAASLLYFVARLLRAIYRTAALSRGARPTMLLAASARRFEHIFSVREPLIAISAKVASPVTLGVWRHTVLLPSALDSELVREDMEAALAHEFAHIARRDFAKNLVHEVLSLPVAFHPLLWLTRRRVAESREMICDAMAAEVVEGKQRYARSLLRLASEFATRTPAVSTHAIGIFDANTFRNFERRVMSLTEKRVEMQPARRTARVALIVALGAGVCTSAMALRMQVAGQSPDEIVPAARMASVLLLKPAASDMLHLTKVDVKPQQVAMLTIKPFVASRIAPAEEAPAPQNAAMSVKSSVMAGQILSKVNPVYPQEAKDAKISGAVLLKAVIGKDGAISDLQVVSGPDVLTKSALDAVRQWKYKPYLLNGQPTEVETTITINYSLQGS